MEICTVSHIHVSENDLGPLKNTLTLRFDILELCIILGRQWSHLQLP